VQTLFFRMFIMNTYVGVCQHDAGMHMFFFLTSNIISLKSAEGRNPSTKVVYKSVPNQRKQRNMNVKTQQT